jgi:DNA-binding response OmpR family regulator
VSKATVAVFNTNEDLVESLCDLLEDEGYDTVRGHITDFERGHTDLIDLLEKHDPRVVVFDIAPPYDEHWTFLKLVMSSHAMDKRGLVVTTTSKRHLDEQIGKDSGAFEIIGKPYDMHQILDAVADALRRHRHR